MGADALLLAPSTFEHEIVLIDGARVRIRSIRPDDEARLVAFYDTLSQQTAYQRFFGAMRRMPRSLAHSLANVDYRRRMALVAEHPGLDGQLIAVARYEVTNEPGVAEVACVVQDDWQNRGLGSCLVQDLLDLAAANGVRAFRAYVLADNQRMLDLLARFTDVHERKTEAGVVTLSSAYRPRGIAAAASTPPPAPR